MCPWSHFLCFAHKFSLDNLRLKPSPKSWGHRIFVSDSWAILPICPGQPCEYPTGILSLAKLSLGLLQRVCPSWSQTSPQGSSSIVHHCQVAMLGAHCQFWRSPLPAHRALTKPVKTPLYSTWVSAWFHTGSLTTHPCSHLPPSDTNSAQTLSSSGGPPYHFCPGRSQLLRLLIADSLRLGPGPLFSYTAHQNLRSQFSSYPPFHSSRYVSQFTLLLGQRIPFQLSRVEFAQALPSQSPRQKPSFPLATPTASVLTYASLASHLHFLVCFSHSPLYSRARHIIGAQQMFAKRTYGPGKNKIREQYGKRENKNGKWKAKDKMEREKNKRRTITI